MRSGPFGRGAGRRGTSDRPPRPLGRWVGRMALTWTATIVLSTAATGPAVAFLRVCNQTLDLLNVALGRAVGSAFRTEGWWVVAANSCAELVREPLAQRYFYIFAIDVRGEPVIEGNTPMCVADASFRIEGVEECWLRGYDRADFREIDTFSAPEWTVFVDPGQ